MSTERFELPMLGHDEGTVEQLAARLAAHAIAYEVSRIEDSGRANGWELLFRTKAVEVARHMRTIAEDLFKDGTAGLEARAAYETARMRGFPCGRCGHRHEGSRYSFRCFLCLCQERPQPR